MRHIDPEMLSGYLLGESTDAASAAVERHLAECATCRRLESELRHVIVTFAGANAQRPRAGGLDSLLAAQQRLGSARRRSAMRTRLWTAGAVAAMLGIFAVGFWTGRRTSPGPLESSPAPVARTRELDVTAPHVTFVAAIPDRVAGLAKRDTTTN
ncbi:MAG: zf-HC2 domain-containing protein [bacterium]|nr:zf-HC2 domain-containing protein [bacterium]